MYDKLHKRPSEVNQQVAKSTRPQLPRDGSKDGQNNVKRMPAGYISVWDFGNGEQTKFAPTTGGGKKVY
ncbi:hypothetical protein [Bacteriophage sp.]|nr:hypothetical protein [Bacteriophage sp.]